MFYYLYIDSTNKRLVQEIVVLVFHPRLENKQVCDSTIGSSIIYLPKLRGDGAFKRLEK